MIPNPRKGHKFHGPDGQGYELTRDVNIGELMSTSDFREFGGAPVLIEGEAPPYWLTRQIYEDKP